MNSSNCLTDHQLQTLLQPDAGQAVDDPLALQHIEDCVPCRERLERLAAGLSSIMTDLRKVHESQVAAHPDRLIQKLVMRPDTPSVRCQERVDWWQDVLGTSSDPHALGCLGGFDILGVLGRGGMGLVLRGFDPQLQRPVAIKIPAQDLANSPDYRLQFLREAQVAASLSHENVVSIFQVGEECACPYLVMELVEGGTLADRMRGQVPFTNEELYHLGRETAQGLEAAHHAGLIHGDLKPANILWDRKVDRYKLADFGLARHVDQQQRRVLAGTPAYMSPEQARGERSDERSDLYSLGLILRDCSTGCMPQIAMSGEWTVDELARTNLPPLRQEAPKIGRRLADTIDALLCDDPQQRIPSAAALRAALSQRLTFTGRPIWVAVATSCVALAALFLTAEALGWVDVVPAIGPTQLVPVVHPFEIEGTEGSYADLASAIQQADDGDRILVNEEGPHLTAPIEIADKSLEIVGAPGLKPVFVPQEVASDHPIPLLATNASLRLRSLEFRFQVAAPRQQEERWDRCAIRVRSAPITLENCRFLVGQSNVAVGIERGSLSCVECEFMGEGGVGIHWLPGQEQPSQISSSLFSTTIGVGVDLVADEDGNGVYSLSLQRAVFRSERAIQVVFNAIPVSSDAASLTIKTADNLFDSQHVVCLFPRSRRRAIELSSWQAARLLRRKLEWTAEGNLYRKDGSPASMVGMRSRPQPIWEESQAEQRWRGEWGDGESKSAWASFQFQGSAASVSPADHRLRSVSMTAGEQTPAWVQSLLENPP